MAVLPYPWPLLEAIPRAALARLALARRGLAGALEPGRVGEALTKLVETEMRIELGVLGVAPPARRETEILFRSGSARVAVGVEPALAAALLGRVLGRPFALSEPGGELTPALAGALSALGVELARRVSEQPVTLDQETGTFSPALSAELTVRMEGRPYRAYALVEGAETPTLTPSSVKLADLGEIVLGVPLVVAVSLATRDDVTRLVPGSAFVPSEAWIDERGHGRGVLAAAKSARGIGVELPPDGRIVLRDATVELALDRESSGETMADANDLNETLTDAALEAPVVVRVELGVVSLSARAWAELKPGDVLQTGQPIGEPVLLRIAGRAVARGELVSVDGEVGVRVRDLFGHAGDP